MADAGILMLTAALVFLITLIIKRCYKPRDNSQLVKHHTNTLDSRRKDVPVRRNRDPQQEEEWRRQDAQRRQRLEAEVQKINHLFNDDTSEEDSAPGQFQLPVRFNRYDRLESSSTDRESAIRVDPPRRRRRHREQPGGGVGSTVVDVCKQRGGGEGSTVVDVCKQRGRGEGSTVVDVCEQWGGGEGSTVVDVCRTPGWIQLQEPLAHTNDHIIYRKTYDELKYHRNKHPSHNMYTYLDKKFELSRRDDMAVMSLIQGTYAAGYMTGDTQQALTQCKQLLRDIHTYHLKYPAIAESQLYWQMYYYYMYKGKPGKAHSAMQAAVSCMQHQAPSAWTALVCHLQGRMYDRLAHVSLGHRNKYQDLAVRCLTQAREHCLHQPCQEMENYLYRPLYNTLETALIKLDMPTLSTMEVFPESEIVHQRLSECVVSQCQVTEAQDLVSSATQQLTTLTAGYRATIDERILICRLIIYIRFTQLAMHDKAHHSALSFMDTAQDLYEEWCDHASGYTDICFDGLPHLPCDIVKTLDTLSARLRLTSPPTLPPEPLSNSLSSEPSDAPPSGLKQLTEESRRAEKQARRDAHQFSYSSGDVYSDRGADVPSDVDW